jgi:hypothetical protein
MEPLSIAIGAAVLGAAGLWYLLYARREREYEER